MQLRTHTAVTLTELLVATILIGIIMVGIVAVDYAMRQTEGTITQSSQIAMNTSANMLDIMKNASVTTGSPGNPGIDISGNTLCLRQDVDSATGTNNLTPADFSDDRWVCYTEDNRELLKCVRAAVGSCVGIQNEKLGTVIDNGFTSQIVNDKDLGRLYLQVTLTNRPDPAAAADTMENPEYTITSKSSPLAYSPDPPAP